jgi:hypothetical protein
MFGAARANLTDQYIYPDNSPGLFAESIKEIRWVYSIEVY